MDLPATTPKRSAGRPRAFDRDQALTLAMQLFWQHGFEGTSTGQLCAAMGIAMPSLYAAFGSKEALYREALALYALQFGRTLTEALSSEGPARDAVQRMLFVAARQFSQASHPPGCMVAGGELQCSTQAAELAAEVAARRDGARRLIRQRLEAAKTAGELPDGTDTAALAGYFAMIVQGLAVQARDGAKAVALKRLASLAMAAWPQG
jgi:AcrR family transcriptional regulator